MNYELYRLLQEQKANNWSMGSSSRGAVHISFCAGYGGLGLGLEAASIDIGFEIHVEIESYAAANLAEKTSNGSMAPSVLFSDLKTFPYRKFRGLVDILSGGFPCQPFSSEGHRRLDSDPRHLWPYFVKAIKAFLPTFLLFENVDGISTATLGKDIGRFTKGSPVLQYVLGELEDLGYVATAVPTTAREVGANHSRTRWFIVGVLNSKGERQQGNETNSKEPTEQSTNKTFFRDANRSSFIGKLRGHIFPNKKKAVQKHKEPTRIIKTDEIITVESPDRYGRVSDKHKMGRRQHGANERLDYDNFAATSPEDEMRMLGNGVCPQQAARAFILGLKDCYRRM